MTGATTAIVVTLAVITALVVSGLAGPGSPADLRVTVAGNDRPASGGRPLEVVVENLGGTSAENVIVQVTVGEVTRAVDLDLVPRATPSPPPWSSSPTPPATPTPRW